MSHLAELVASAKAAISQASDVAALDNVRVEYLGKKGRKREFLLFFSSQSQENVIKLIQLNLV